MTTKTTITASDFWEMTGNDRYELVRGELVEKNRPNMEHGLVCKNVIVALELWSRKNSSGYVFANDTGVITDRDPDTVRGPDCMYVRTQRLPRGTSLKGWLELAPDLAVEVLSPNDRWAEVIAKVSEYLEAGVCEVWVLDSDVQIVHVFRTDAAPITFPADAELTSEDVLPGFRVKVAEFFVGV